MWVYILAALLILLAYYAIRRGDPEPYLGVYSQPGKWFLVKYAVFYAVLFARRRFGLAASNAKAGAAGYGKKARTTLDELDDVQALSDHKLAIDAAYFNGYNEDGFYFGAGVQRRPKGRVESLLFLRIPGLGFLEWPHSPSTATSEAEPNTYSAEGGLRFRKVEAMKRWAVTFDGQLKIKETGRLVRVKFDFVWTATTDWFDFDTDMHPHPVCESIAREPWSRAFFDRLRDAHQTHHEQFGVLSGRLHVDGDDGKLRREMKNIQLKSMRDHSYGLYRDWNDFHRYILQYFAFDDGSHMALHLVCLKPTMTHLITGFLMDKSGHKRPIFSCDIALYEIGGETDGEKNTPPEKYEFVAKAAGNNGEVLRVQCELVQSPPPVYYCGWNREAKIHVYMCKVVMNGVNGRGMCEFEYNNAGI